MFLPSPVQFHFRDLRRYTTKWTHGHFKCYKVFYLKIEQNAAVQLYLFESHEILPVVRPCKGPT